MRPFLRSVSLLALLGAALSASALLIDPKGGTTVFGPGTDDSTSLRSLGGTFSLYGESLDTLYLASNGYLTTASATPLVLDRGVGSMASVLGGPVIAGLFDDLRAYDGNGVSESVGKGYYAATFDMPAFGFPAAGGEQRVPDRAVQRRRASTAAPPSRRATSCSATTGSRA